MYNLHKRMEKIDAFYVTRKPQNGPFWLFKIKWTRTEVFPNKLFIRLINKNPAFTQECFAAVVLHTLYLVTDIIKVISETPQYICRPVSKKKTSQWLWWCSLVQEEQGNHNILCFSELLFCGSPQDGSSERVNSQCFEEKSIFMSEIMLQCL